MAPKKPKTKLKLKQGGARSFMRPANLLTSLLLVFPLFLIYQIGVLAMPSVHNGVDLITSELLRTLHGQVGTYVLINLALAVAFLVAVVFLRRNHSFDVRLFVPVLLESGIYAITMGTVICWVMQDVLHISPTLAVADPTQAGPLAKIVLACGAGVHEELVFRLIGVTALVGLGRLIGMRRVFALGMAFVVTAVLFSAAHTVIGGEPFHIGAFVYRFLCGLIFAALFEWRGFAVAVYTHALYDMYVLLLR